MDVGVCSKGKICSVTLLWFSSTVRRVRLGVALYGDGRVFFGVSEHGALMVFWDLSLMITVAYLVITLQKNAINNRKRCVFLCLRWFRGCVLAGGVGPPVHPILMSAVWQRRSGTNFKIEAARFPLNHRFGACFDMGTWLMTSKSPERITWLVQTSRYFYRATFFFTPASSSQCVYVRQTWRTCQQRMKPAQTKKQNICPLNSRHSHKPLITARKFCLILFRHWMSLRRIIEWMYLFRLSAGSGLMFHLNVTPRHWDCIRYEKLI